MKPVGTELNANKKVGYTEDKRHFELPQWEVYFQGCPLYNKSSVHGNL